MPSSLEEGVWVLIAGAGGRVGADRYLVLLLFCGRAGYIRGVFFFLGPDLATLLLEDEGPPYCCLRMGLCSCTCVNCFGCQGCWGLTGVCSDSGRLRLGCRLVEGTGWAADLGQGPVLGLGRRGLKPRCKTINNRRPSNGLLLKTVYKPIYVDRPLFNWIAQTGLFLNYYNPKIDGVDY